MTGYGQVFNEKYALTAEVRSLNSKYTDVVVRLPKEFSDKEYDVRQKVGEALERGKIMVTVEFCRADPAKNKNETLDGAFATAFQQLKKLADKAGAPYDGLFQLAWNIAQSELATEPLPPEIIPAFEDALREAISQCQAFRLSEGRTLEMSFRKYIAAIGEKLNLIAAMDTGRLEKIRGKMKSALTDFFGTEGFDQNRLEQEIIFYIEKLDIHEERVRLQSHLDYFLETLDEKQSNGKKLGFIAQEIGREINTIGSKANDASMQKLVVDMKEELEKIKEQANNLL